MKDIQEYKKIKCEPEKAIVVGPEYDFWLNEEDDVYDELYRDKSLLSFRTAQ